MVACVPRLFSLCPTEWLSRPQDKSQDRFLSLPFQIINHKLSYHSILHKLQSWKMSFNKCKISHLEAADLSDDTHLDFKIKTTVKVRLEHTHREPVAGQHKRELCYAFPADAHSNLPSERRVSADVPRGSVISSPQIFLMLWKLSYAVHFSLMLRLWLQKLSHPVTEINSLDRLVSEQLSTTATSLVFATCEYFSGQKTWQQYQVES
jgi:hypothetical protein